jgi:DNA ligase-1
LYLDGKLLIDEPLSKRRELIRSLKLPEAAMISPARDVETAEDIEREFKLAKATRGNEGLMIKDPASKYTVGKRGYDWIKYKKALEPFDVVVVAAEQGHGKKNEYLSDLTFAVWNKDKTELVTLGKVFSGLKDSDIVTLTEWFKANTISSEGRVYQVKPEVILEVAYENIQESDRNESGYALRFPRIKAIRTDKPLDEINTIEDVKHIYEEFCKGGME